MTDIVKKQLKQLEHATDLDAAFAVLAESTAADTLYELLLESNHHYIIDGNSRGYLAAIIHLSRTHHIILDTASERMTQHLIGEPD